MSFILDALRKSEHERQRSAVPGLSQVPLATPEPQLPRWAVGVMAVLAAALLVIGGAWWQSTRAPAQVAATPPPTVEREVELPPPAYQRAVPQQSAPARLSSPESAPSLAAAAAPSAADAGEAAAPSLSTPRQFDLPADAPALPSAASLAAEGIPIPMLRLELHAYSERPRDRFVFINGRKYAEGDRLPEGPQVVSIEPTGAVLSHAGRRFLLVQE